MQAKLKTKTYDCINVRQSNANDGANTLSLLLTGVESVDEVRDEATNCAVVEITDEGGVRQVYEDYINFQSVATEEDTVEVTMRQDNAIKQLATLKAVVKEQAETIAMQGQTISAQAAQIASQETTITEQAARIEELDETQADQDDAINYLLMGGEEDGEVSSEAD